MDVGMLSIVSSAVQLLQRVIPHALLPVRSTPSQVATHLQKVHQATGVPMGRPAMVAQQSPFTRARQLLLSKAHQDISGTRREFATNIVEDSNAALRSGNKKLAGHILATGLATVLPAWRGAVNDENISMPEALHRGWQGNLGRGVSALIASADQKLHLVQFEANADLVHGNPFRDALLDAIRENPRITVNYRHSITNAALLNNEGRHGEALATLRSSPHHEPIMSYSNAPSSTPSSDVASRDLSTAHERLYMFGNFVNGDGEAPPGAIGQEVQYARDNPDALAIRGLVQSVGAELYRIGAYREVLDTVRPPLPPKPAA
jgi:hypothetical protein